MPRLVNSLSKIVRRSGRLGGGRLPTCPSTLTSRGDGSQPGRPATAIRDRGGLRRLRTACLAAGVPAVRRGAKNPPRADLIVSGYRRQVALESAEIERIPAMMRVRPVVLTAWSFCLGRWSAEQATRAALNARQVAERVGPRVVAAFRARPS